VDIDEDDGLLESDGGSPQQRGYGEDVDDMDDVDDQRENPGMVSELRGRGVYARSECSEFLLRRIILMLSNQIAMIDPTKQRMKLLPLALGLNDIVSGLFNNRELC
jgi:hypothetical protein